jgi:cell division protein FtsN
VARLQVGSLPLTPLGIPLSGVRTGWNLRDSQIVRAVDELTRYLADRIPGPDGAAPVKADWRYELQVGAYLDHQLALEQRDTLAARGLPAAVHTEMRQATIWHKVTVGPYTNENEALAVRRQLENQLGVRPFLRRLPL